MYITLLCNLGDCQVLRKDALHCSSVWLHGGHQLPPSVHTAGFHVLEDTEVDTSSEGTKPCVIHSYALRRLCNCSHMIYYRGTQKSGSIWSCWYAFAEKWGSSEKESGLLPHSVHHHWTGKYVYMPLSIDITIVVMQIWLFLSIHRLSAWILVCNLWVNKNSSWRLDHNNHCRERPPSCFSNGVLYHSG